MLYVIFGLDTEGAGPLRAFARPQHLERVKALHAQGRVAMVGPMPAVDAPTMEAGVTGSLIVAEFDSLEDARAWVAEDPYVKAGVYASLEIRPFLQVQLS